MFVGNSRHSDGGKRTGAEVVRDDQRGGGERKGGRKGWEQVSEGGKGPK